MIHLLLEDGRSVLIGDNEVVQASPRNLHLWSGISEEVTARADRLLSLRDSERRFVRIGYGGRYWGPVERVRKV